MFTSVGDVMSSYKSKVVDAEYGGDFVDEGFIKVLIVLRKDGWYDVWNIHPLRKGWQLVYSIEECNPEQQVKESLDSLKRLFEE